MYQIPFVNSININLLSEMYIYGKQSKTFSPILSQIIKKKHGYINSSILITQIKIAKPDKMK